MKDWDLDNTVAVEDDGSWKDTFYGDVDLDLTEPVSGKGDMTESISQYRRVGWPETVNRIYRNKDMSFEEKNSMVGGMVEAEVKKNPYLIVTAFTAPVFAATAYALSKLPRISDQPGVRDIVDSFSEEAEIPVKDLGILGRHVLKNYKPISDTGDLGVVKANPRADAKGILDLAQTLGEMVIAGKIDSMASEKIFEDSVKQFGKKLTAAGYGTDKVTVNLDRLRQQGRGMASGNAIRQNLEVRGMEITPKIAGEIGKGANFAQPTASEALKIANLRKTAEAGVAKVPPVKALEPTIPPKEALTPQITPITPIVEPVSEVKPATQSQKIEAHRIAKEKALITPEGKVKPQYRRLATLVTGEKSIAKMTESEANEFIYNLERISEPVYKKGKLIPPTIPKTKALVEPEFFRMKFRKPTPVKLVTSQARYAELLGVKKLVEPMEIGKQEVDIEYAKGVQQIDIANKKLKSIKGVSSEEMAKMLNIYEEAPPSLSKQEKEVFDYYRSLTKDMLIRENAVRETLDLPLIQKRQAYFRHIADRMSQEIIDGKYPLPEGLKYWSEQTVGKKVYNPMEMQRKLRDDLLERFSSDLPYVMKSMLWSGLKEIHLSIPKHILNKELGTLTKDKKVYKNLSPEEQKLYDAQMTMPASTKKWLLDYVNIVLGGRQTALDESVNLWVTDTPIKKVVNSILKPFGKHIGQKPLTNMISSFSKLPIYGAMGGVNPRQLIRNKFQTIQLSALYGVKNTLKGYMSVSSYPVLQELKTDSLFRKSYSGFEDMPTGTMKKIEKIGLAPYQWTAISNVSQAMNTSFHWTTDNIQNPKKAHLGWADSQRTYKEAGDFFYPSEKATLLKEMEYGAHTTQYQYIGMGMPEIFRYKALAPFTRLQSWWMNHWFVFHREAATRAFTGYTGYDSNLRITLGDRINYLKYLILGGLILVNLGYYRSYLFGTAPTSVAPTGQLMMGLYTYFTNTGDTSWEKKNRGLAEYQIKEALKIHIPGYLSIKDTTALIKGDKDWTEYLFYNKQKSKKLF